MRVGTVGRWFAAAAVPAALVVGCSSSKHNSSSTPGGGSMLCGAGDECPRGNACGCVGMDAGCNCDDCQEFGQCHLPSGADSSAPGVRCVPSSLADCVRPDGACDTYGLCHFGADGAGPACVVGADDDCRASKLCAKYGACTADLVLNACEAGSAEDCAGSAVCSEFGCCSFVDVDCVKNDGTCPYKCCGTELC